MEHAADLPSYPRPAHDRPGAPVAGPASRVTRGAGYLLGAVLTLAWLALAVAAAADLQHLDRYPDAVAAGMAGVADTAGLATGLGGAACAVAATVAFAVRCPAALWLFLASVAAPLFGVIALVVLVMIPAH